MRTEIKKPEVQATTVVGGDIPNQESALGAGVDNYWRWWKVLAGFVACMTIFFGLVATGLALFGWFE